MLEFFKSSLWCGFGQENESSFAYFSDVFSCSSCCPRAQDKLGQHFSIKSNKLPAGGLYNFPSQLGRSTVGDIFRGAELTSWPRFRHRPSLRFSVFWVVFSFLGEFQGEVSARKLFEKTLPRRSTPKGLLAGNYRTNAVNRRADLAVLLVLELFACKLQKTNSFEKFTFQRRSIKNMVI